MNISNRYFSSSPSSNESIKDKFKKIFNTSTDMFKDLFKIKKNKNNTKDHLPIKKLTPEIELTEDDIKSVQSRMELDMLKRINHYNDRYNVPRVTTRNLRIH
jgi:hypothetical protein